MKHHQKMNPKSNQKTLKIHSKIVVFSRTLQKHFFFAPRTAPGHLKVAVLIFVGSFLAPPWILRGPQNHPKSAKWRQKAPKIIPSLLLELSWNRPFSKIAPRTFLGIIFNDFGWILMNFSIAFDPFSS